MLRHAQVFQEYKTSHSGHEIVSFTAFQVNHIDIAPSHAAVMMGITNGFANLCGIAAPYVAGVIINDGVWFALLTFQAKGLIYRGFQLSGEPGSLEADFLHICCNILCRQHILLVFCIGRRAIVESWRQT